MWPLCWKCLRCGGCLSVMFLQAPTVPGLAPRCLLALQMPAMMEEALCPFVLCLLLHFQGAGCRDTCSWSRGASWSPAREDQQLPGHQSQLQLEIIVGSNDTFYHCNASNAASNAASWGTATIHVKPLCNFPATASLLSYCQAKGLILLLVLGALITRAVAVHIMAGKQPKWD